MNQNSDTTVGDVIALVYEEMLGRYGDKTLASIAASAMVNDLFINEYCDPMWA